MRESKKKLCASGRRPFRGISNFALRAERNAHRRGAASTQHSGEVGHSCLGVEQPAMRDDRLSGARAGGCSGAEHAAVGGGGALICPYGTFVSTIPCCPAVVTSLLHVETL